MSVALTSPTLDQCGNRCCRWNGLTIDFPFQKGTLFFILRRQFPLNVLDWFWVRKRQTTRKEIDLRSVACLTHGRPQEKPCFSRLRRVGWRPSDTSLSGHILGTTKAPEDLAHLPNLRICESGQRARSYERAASCLNLRFLFCSQPCIYDFTRSKRSQTQDRSTSLSV